MCHSDTGVEVREHMDPQDRTQVAGLGSKSVYPLNHLISSRSQSIYISPTALRTCKASCTLGAKEF